MDSRHAAGVVSRLAGAAHIRPDLVDRTGRRDPDFADQGGAAVADATHPRCGLVHELSGDPGDLGVGLERETRPLPGKGAAGATALAIRKIGERGPRILRQWHVHFQIGLHPSDKWATWLSA